MIKRAPGSDARSQHCRDASSARTQGQAYTCHSQLARFRPLQKFVPLWLISGIARSGYAARGAIYLIVGTLALLVSLDAGGQITDADGAMRVLLRERFGKALLGALGAGLAAYSLWRLIQGLVDTDEHGIGLKGLGIRASLLISGITHGFLSLSAWKLMLGNDERKQQLSELPIDATSWQIVSWVVGICFFIAGVAHLYKGAVGGFRKYIELPRGARWTNWICRFGLSARGVVWLIAGWFIIRTAIAAEREEFAGLAKALTATHESSYGKPLLFVVAVGLLSFSFYSFLASGFRKVEISP